MTPSDLETLYDYAYWANRQLFEVLRTLTPEEFTQSVAGSYGSIRNTLVHVMSAEWGWLDRCGGPARGPKFKPEEYPTAESLIDKWTILEAYMRAYLARMTDADVTREAHYANERGEPRAMPIGELLQHGAMHSVHHRGQVAMLLRMLGHAPGNWDIVLYHAERHGVSAF